MLHSGYSKWIFSLLVIMQATLIFVNQENIFFWDTVQFAGKHGSYFYDYGLTNGFLLPDHIDSGHPPTFGYFLSLVWNILGRSLIVSHWAMFPILVGILYQAYKLDEYLNPRKTSLFILLLFVCPFYLGHSILVSPDLVVILGFLLSLRGVLIKQDSLVTIGILLMSSMSLRGAAIGVAIMLYDLFTDRSYSIFQFWKLPWIALVKKYALGFSLLTLYLGYHYFTKGWLVQHPTSSWAPSFESVGVGGMIKNLFRIIWRLADFGMIGIYLVLLSRVRFIPLLKDRLVWLAIFLFVILAILTVPYVGLVNHRYFLPIQIVALLIGSQLLGAFNKNWLTAIVVVFLFAGNFWIYPDSISQGWDSTYAHQPFYTLEQESLSRMNTLDIDPKKVGTAFPMRSDRNYLSLDKSKPSYKQFDYKTDQYLLYSNVMNEFKDIKKESFFEHSEVVFTLEKRGIEITLYKLKD